MKILYIITQADGGGAQKYTLALARHFGGAIAAGADDSKLFDEARKSGLEIFPLQYLRREINPLHDFLAVWEIRQLIKSYNPDIIHLNSSKAGVVGSFAGIGLKTKVIFTAHGFIFNEPLSHARRTFYLALEKIASGYRDFIITVSDADRQSALSNNLISPNKITTIHNGIESIEFLSKDEARHLLNLPSDKIIIGSVANFYKTKGLDVLIAAIAILADDVKSKIICAIVGEGQERENLEFRIKNLGLNDTLKLLGKVDNAPNYLKTFDIFVLPSRKEGFPYTLLEAMQACLPIIATKVGGNLPEALGEAALFVDPENPKQLAEALTILLNDADKRKALGQRAQDRAKLFTLSKMLAETETVYKKLLLDLD